MATAVDLCFSIAVLHRSAFVGARSESLSLTQRRQASVLATALLVNSLLSAANSLYDLLLLVRPTITSVRKLHFYGAILIEALGLELNLEYN